MEILLERVPKMPKKKPDSPPTEAVRLYTPTVRMLEEIAEARGKEPRDIVDEMLAATLPTTHKAIQTLLKRVREEKRKTEEMRQQFQKGHAG